MSNFVENIVSSFCNIKAAHIFKQEGHEILDCSPELFKVKLNLKHPKLTGTVVILQIKRSIVLLRLCA